MTSTIKDAIQRYGIAFLLAVAATWLREVIEPWVHDRVPFGTYLVAVILTAWLVGTGPATASLLLGILAAAHFFLPPDNSFVPGEWGDLLALLVYGTVGAVAISLFHRTRQQHNVTRGQLQKIESLSAALQSADRRKDEFLAILSHELRNPLAPIRNGILLLQKSEADNPQWSDILQTMGRQLEQLVRIVDDLLDVSRFIRGRIKLDCRPVDLRELVEIAVAQAQTDIDHRRHELRAVLPPRPVTVCGDHIRIVQIVTNLLTNAAKYTPRDGTIHVLLETDPCTATLQVVDNGIGITDEMLPHIFELFTRTPAASGRDQSGLGLGLPIAKQFAEMHNGRLEVHSDGAGQGSRFVLVLPLAEDAITPAERESSLLTAADSLPALSDETPAVADESTRVLVVDDNRDAAETMATLLKLYEFNTCTAEDGPQALRKVGQFQPSIVLLDIGLPGMDGYEVARRLRADQQHRDLRIIAVTGWGAKADIQKSHASGIDHHLIKPVDPAELLRLMQPPASSAAVVV